MYLLGVLIDLKFSSQIDVIVTKAHQRASPILLCFNLRCFNVGSLIYFWLLLLMSDSYSSLTVKSGLLLIPCW